MSQTTASIRYLKDKDEEVFFPVAHEKGVVDSSGTTLETKLGQKQDNLVSGTNIKTINNESILGGGNITVQTSITTDATPTSGSTNPVQSGGVYTALSGKQATLVSGTNIKTINNQSLVGAGDIEVAVSDSQVEQAVDDWLDDHKGELDGLSYAARTALMNLFLHVAYCDDNGREYYDALYNALFPPSSLVSIEAVFTQGSNVIYDNASLDSLKQYLVVTATYDDSSQSVIPSTGYTLSGTLTAGTSTITAICGNKSDEFDVIVTHATVQYTITNNLTQCTNSNAATIINELTTYSGTLTPSSGYVLETVTVTMGGTDITSTAYSSGTISIASVTGNIVITAVATEDVGWISGVPYDLSVGYTDNYYLVNGVETQYNNWCISPYLPVNGAFVISTVSFIKQYCGNYDTEKTYISSSAIPAGNPVYPGNHYLRVSESRSKVLGATITPYRLPIITDSTVVAVNTWYTYDAIEGKYVNNTNGQEVVGSSYACSDYLNCFGMSTVLINEPAGTWGSVVFFDGNKEYISGVTKTNIASWNTATEIPSGARYVRISGSKDFKLAIKFE